jgi:tetratricopeptide (TPR) repeat protein
MQGFIGQRDDLALVVQSPESDCLPIWKTIEGLEANNPSDLFWIFTDRFTDPVSYADAVVAAFSTIHAAMHLAMKREGLAPWPDIPPHVGVARTPPAQRLRTLAAFSRELLPIPLGGNNVWALYPLEIADPVAFATLMRDVLNHEMPFPWCHHLRFIIREDPSAPMLRSALRSTAGIDWYQPDLGAEAVYRGLQEDSADETQPLEQRLSSVLVMAGADVAIGRHEQAIEKYELLLQYHAPRGNLAMAAVALNGMGEAYEKLQNPGRAEECYHAALIPASHGDQPPIAVLLNVVLNLANLRFAQQRWSEAEPYYDAAQQLATVARDGGTKVRALERRGICQRWQGQMDEAERSWIDGSVIAAQLEDVALCRSNVERLAQHYAETGRRRDEYERREQLASLSASGSI